LLKETNLITFIQPVTILCLAHYKLPETGMGYQLVRVILKNGKVLRNHKVLNGSVLLLEQNEHLTKDDIAMVEAEK